MLCPQGAISVPLGGAIGYGWFPLTSGGQVADGGTVARAADTVSRVSRPRQRALLDDPRKLVLSASARCGCSPTASRSAIRPRFAGLAALSSWLPLLGRDSSRDRGAPPARHLVQHGSHDEVIAVARARQSVETLRGLGVPLTYARYAMGHEINGASLTDLSTCSPRRSCRRSY